MRSLCVRLLGLWLAIAGQAQAQVYSGVYIDCLWEGATAIRQEDFKALREAKFDLFATQITGKALTDAKSFDAQFLDACKASGAKAVVIPNALAPEQWKPLVAKWPEVVLGIQLQDDANLLKPAEVAANVAAAGPFLSVPGLITVAKNANHPDYASKTPLYHVQTYLGKAVSHGDGMRRFAYDGMLAARAACPGKLLGAMYVARGTTPYHLRTNPVFRAQEFATPATQEAVAWLQLIAGADHLLSYSAYWIDRDNPLWESRLGERWDLLAGYERINARIKEYEPFLAGAGVVKGRSVEGNTVIGTWTKPTGEKLMVRVDLTSELYPRPTWEVTKPLVPVVVNVKLTSDGNDIRIDRVPP